MNLLNFRLTTLMTSYTPDTDAAESLAEQVKRQKEVLEMERKVSDILYKKASFRGFTYIECVKGVEKQHSCL